MVAYATLIMLIAIFAFRFGSRALSPRPKRLGKYCGEFYPLWIIFLMTISIVFTFVASRFGDTSIYNTRYIIYDQAIEFLWPTIGIILIYVIAYWISYTGISFYSPRKIVRQAKNVEIKNNRVLGWTLLFLVLVSSAFALILAFNNVSIHSEEALNFGGSFNSVISIIAKFYIKAPALAVALIFVPRFKDSKVRKLGILILFICILVGMLIGLKTVVKEGLVFPGIYLIVGAFCCGLKVPKRVYLVVIFGALGGLFLIQGARLKAGRALVDNTLTDTVEMSLDFNSDPKALTGYGLYITTRANLYLPLAQSVRSVQEGNEMSGESWINPILFCVPSFIYKSKPAPFDQNEFGKLIGASDNNQYLTVVRPTHVGEPMITFGIFGVIITAVVTGLLIGMLENLSVLLSEVSIGFSRMSIAAIWSSFIDCEGPLSYSLGGMCKLIVIFAFLLCVVRIFGAAPNTRSKRLIGAL
ncbi:oligosaccharide repeat unit polymerase [Akkermansiaceae bacterium]|nr:oligosaccharide repeat unit polymerase [Akkermansiaceae bacterium]